MGLDDELATAFVENIAKQEITSSVNNATIHVRSSSCDLTRTLQHQHANVTSCDMASSFNNHHLPTTLPTTTTHRTTTMHIRPATTSTSHKPNPRKRPRPPKKDDNRPTNAHDRLTTATTTRNGHDHFQTTTSDHGNQQRPPSAHPTAPYL